MIWNGAFHLELIKAVPMCNLCCQLALSCVKLENIVIVTVKDRSDLSERHRSMLLKTKSLNKNDTTMKHTFPHLAPFGELAQWWLNLAFFHSMAKDNLFHAKSDISPSAFSSVEYTGKVKKFSGILYIIKCSQWENSLHDKSIASTLLEYYPNKWI